MRKYKSGTSWCIWRWTEVDSEYITRLHIIKTPWWAVCLHWIKKPDPEPYLHDHPVSFTSYLLRGWYAERRWVDKYNTGFSENPWRLVQGKNRITAAPWDRHSIVTVPPEGCLTLCFMGPKVREWGFHTPNGWVMWKDYYAHKRKQT